MAFDATSFRTTFIYRQTAAIAVLQSEVRQAIAFYTAMEQQYNAFTVALIVCIAAPILVLFSIPILGDWSWMLILGFVCLGIYAGTMRNRARQFHLPRDRERLFSELLTLLQRDMEQDEALAVELYLGNRTHQGKAIETCPHPDHANCQLEQWRATWFNLKGKFIDRSLFTLKLVECFNITRPLSEDSPNGLTQKPSDDGFELQLQLNVPSERYGSLTPLQSHLEGAVRVLPGAILLRHYGAGQTLNLTVVLPATFTASSLLQSITMLLLSAYQILNLAAQLPKQASASQGAVLSLEAWVDG